MTTDEIKLITELQNVQTKEQAFRVLVHQYKERLYWHIRKIVLIHADADDILQNTFIKIYKNIGSFKGDSLLYTWMYRIATNEAITFIKIKSKKKHLNITEYQESIANNLQDDVYFSGDKIQLILQKAIATLPQRQQLVFNMKYFDSLKYKEIAIILNTSVGALKASYHHAVKKIEQYIKNTHQY